MRKKVLIFHPTIAPYRIRFFNEINSAFDATICLYYRNLKSQKFNYAEIERRFEFSPHYLQKSINLFGRSFYLGHSMWIKKVQPDVVIVNEYGSGLWSAVLTRLVSRKKYKLITICDDSEDIARKRKKLRKITRDLAVRIIDGIILCNDEAREWYSRFSKPSFVFPIIQSESDFFFDKNEARKRAFELLEEYKLFGKRVFLFVGRLSPEKNLSYLVESFIHQHHDNPENVLFIVGGYSDNAPMLKDELKKIINDNSAEDYVKLVGRKEGTELKAWYYLGQVFVLPSIQEPFGAVVNEAMIAGELVMVSKVAGASCLVNDGNGKIIDVGDKYIDFSTISKQVQPLSTTIEYRPNRTPYTFKQKMDDLIKWLIELI